MDVLWGKIVDFIFDDMWPNLQFWRVVGLLALSLLVFAFSFRNKIVIYLRRNTAFEKDKDRFSESDQLMNEDDFKSLIESLGINRIYGWQSHKAHRFIEYFNKMGNKYHNKKIRKLNANVIESLGKLMLFVATHFFWFPEHQDTEDRDNIQSMLYPELRYSPPQSDKGRIYKQRMNELYQLLGL